MPARYTPPVPYRACQGTVWQWPSAVQAAVDRRAVPGLTATTVIVAGALLRFADRDDGTARPGLEQLAARTQLARRTLLLHLGLLVDAGLLVRVARGRHTTLVEQLRTGRHRSAAVYRLALPVASSATATAPPAPTLTARPARARLSPVHSCTPPGSITQNLKTPVTHEQNAGLTAGGDTAPTRPGCTIAAARSRRPPPRAGTRRWERWQAADELRAAVPLVLGGCSTPAVASAMRQGLAEGWTTADFVLLLDRRPLPALPDRLGGRADLRRPAGLLAWRINDWFGRHGPLRPTAVHADELRQRRTAEIRRRAADARTLAEIHAAEQTAATPEQVAAHTAAVRRERGWIRGRGDRQPGSAPGRRRLVIPTESPRDGPPRSTSDTPP